MQGNGQFCIAETGNTRPARLELQQSTNGFVNIIAILGDLRVCVACFRNGMYDPNVIPIQKAAQMGIRLNNAGHILQVAL